MDSSQKKFQKLLLPLIPVVVLVGAWFFWRHHSHSTGEIGSVSENVSSKENAQQKSEQIVGTKTVGSSAHEKSVSAPSHETASETPKGSVATGSAPQAESPAATTAPAEGCFLVTYKHKSLPNHPSEDECSHHRNQIKLPRELADASSLCIRVNGVATHFERVDGSKDEFVIGNVAGPRDTITARFCTGKHKCSDVCNYPKKEVVMRDSFLDAIGGTDDEDSETNGGWQAGDAQKSAEVNKALDGEIRAELENPNQPKRALASKTTSASNSNLEIFKEWLNEGEKGACGTQLAAH